MKAGALYSGEKPLIRIKGVLSGPEKKIESADGLLLLRTDIRNLKAPAESRGDVRYRQYRMLDTDENEVAVAAPAYAAAEDPAVCGWPACRMPRVDHAQCAMQGGEYRLVMQNSQNYQVEAPSDEIVLQIFHRGLAGGWDITAASCFCPAVIGGLYVFCRYMEQENEFLIV